MPRTPKTITKPKPAKKVRAKKTVSKQILKQEIVPQPTGPKLYNLTFDTPFSKDQVLVVEAINELTASKIFEQIKSANQYIKIRLNDKLKSEAICLSTNITNLRISLYSR